jgi:hypothetical protein
MLSPSSSGRGKLEPKRAVNSSRWPQSPLVPLLLAIAGCGAATTAGSDSGAEGDVMARADTAPQADAGRVSDSGAEGHVMATPGCEAGVGATASPDAAACSIDLNQYDRSCSVDADCVSTVKLSCAVYPGSRPVPNLYVHGGDFCVGCNCNMGAAINQSAVTQYIADVSRTPEGSGQVAFPFCNCPPTPPNPSCINGSCGLPGAVGDAGLSE